MKLTISKSKNTEPFYISKSYVNDNGVSTSVIVRKLGTLSDLLSEHGPTRDDAVVCVKEETQANVLLSRLPGSSWNRLPIGPMMSTGHWVSLQMSAALSRKRPIGTATF